MDNTDRPLEPLTDEGILAIHDGAMEILKNIAIEFLNKEAPASFKDAGCKVIEEKVYLDRHWVMEMVGKAPSEFTITPRNPARTLPVGGNKMFLVTFHRHQTIGILNLAAKSLATVSNAKTFSNSVNTSTASILLVAIQLSLWICMPLYATLRLPMTSSP